MIRESAFRFRLWPTLVLVPAIPLFTALGLWQLDRAEQKQALAATLSARAELAPLTLSGPVADPQALQYRSLQARGTFEPAHQVFIENRRHRGETGFHVITPLRIAGSEVRVLVNRGWVPAAAGNAIPEVATPSGSVEIHGEGELPAPPPLALAGADAAATWGARWPYLTTELFAATVDFPVLPLLILQDPADADGFARSWSRELPGPEMHVGYAIQWFAFAVIALVLYLYLGRANDDEETRT